MHARFGMTLLLVLFLSVSIYLVKLKDFRLLKVQHSMRYRKLMLSYISFKVSWRIAFSTILLQSFSDKRIFFFNSIANSKKKLEFAWSLLHEIERKDRKQSFIESQTCLTVFTRRHLNPADSPGCACIKNTTT